MAKTASLNATNRLVSRYTEDGSAPALPPGARAIVSQRTQRITEETPATPRRATHVGHQIDQGLSARVSARQWQKHEIETGRELDADGASSSSAEGRSCGPPVDRGVVSPQVVRSLISVRPQRMPITDRARRRRVAVSSR